VSGFAARLRSVTEAHGGASALARAITRSEGAVRKWLRGESEPSVSDLRAICATTATSATWLIDGANEDAPADGGIDAPRSVASDVRADCALLEKLLERVDMELASGHVELTSVQRAALVVTLFQLFHENKSIDSDTLARLVRLARG
jgi:transcriptional regulator with XRE-family HTH domain